MSEWESMATYCQRKAGNCLTLVVTPPAHSLPLSQGRYTPAWRHHVLSHLPFYTILLPKFLELTLGRLSYRSDAAVLDALLVLEVWRGVTCWATLLMDDGSAFPCLLLLAVHISLPQAGPGCLRS